MSQLVVCTLGVILSLLLSLDCSNGIQCLECVYVQGVTDKVCLRPRGKAQKLLKNCTLYEIENKEDTLPYCEVAWGCYNDGLVKMPALHRICSLGPANLLENNTSVGYDRHCEELEPGGTKDGKRITNLHACFCKNDTCNYPSTRLLENKEDAWLRTVCSSPPRFSVMVVLTVILPLLISLLSKAP